MENKITIYLNYGNFSEGFNSINIQLNQTQKITTTLPPTTQIPHVYKNWQKQFNANFILGFANNYTGYYKSCITDNIWRSTNSRIQL
ncbi:MAG: hypothetical protein F6K24_23075 [Okeania sp. SIO2D1]|nr:hypothetical protein [Okeania sp. SIO2D1]